MYSFKKIPLLRPWCCAVLAGLLAGPLPVMFPGATAHAAEGVLANPTSAVLSPSGGRLEVEETAPVSTKDNVSVVTFVIPGRRRKSATDRARTDRGPLVHDAAGS